MKTKSSDNQNPHKNNFIRQLGDVLLFVKAVSDSEFSKLTKGKAKSHHIMISFKRLEYPGTILEMMESSTLRKQYGLENNFSFDSPCRETLILESYYNDFKKIVEKAVAENPKLSFNELLHLQFCSQSKPKKPVGRQKVFRDFSSGKIFGVKKENVKLIEIWEETGDVEAIRLHFHPKTKMATTKKVEASKIMRKLRDYNHLLIRKYNEK